MADITVVIPTYNRCESLEATLKSLIEQENNENLSWEVIVVDNNSTDMTKKIVESYNNLSSGKINYVFEKNQGRTFALNTGIKSAKGNLIAITDDDCVADKRWLVNIKKIFATKKIDLLAGKIIAKFEGRLPDWLDIEKMHGPMAHFDKGEHYFENDGNKIVLPTGANTILRKSAFDKYGAYQYDGRAEDTELGYRWQNLGAKIAYSPDVIVYHYNDASRLTKKYFRKWYFLGGKNIALIRRGEYLSGRTLAGIPLWIYREILINFAQYSRSLIAFKKDYFYYELNLCCYVGMVWGCRNFKTNFENLR